MVHINANHLEQIQGAGFTNAESFIEYVINNSNELYKAVTGQLLIVSREPNNNVMYIELRPEKEGDQDYYRINSAFPVKFDDYAERRKFESLIKGSKPLFTASGEQYGYAALPDSKARFGSPNATDKNDADSLSQPYKNTSGLSVEDIKKALPKALKKLLAAGKLQVLQKAIRISRNTPNPLMLAGLKAFMTPIWISFTLWPIT